MHKTLSYYNDNAKELSERYESANMGKIHNLLIKTFLPKSALLEIGCGSGRDASFMYENDYDILAIDGSEDMINEAKQYHPELADKLRVMKIPDEFNFEASSFDGIYSIATLMHLEKDVIDHTFETIATILKPGGQFFFSVSIQRNDIDNQGKDENKRHFTTMFDYEWVSNCEKYGMNPVHREIFSDGLDREGISWLTCILRKDI